MHAAESSVVPPGCTLLEYLDTVVLLYRSLEFSWHACLFRPSELRPEMRVCNSVLPQAVVATD